MEVVELLLESSQTHGRFLYFLGQFAVDLVKVLVGTGVFVDFIEV